MTILELVTALDLMNAPLTAIEIRKTVSNKAFFSEALTTIANTLGEMLEPVNCCARIHERETEYCVIEDYQVIDLCSKIEVMSHRFRCVRSLMRSSFVLLRLVLRLMQK